MSIGSKSRKKPFGGKRGEEEMTVTIQKPEKTDRKLDEVPLLYLEMYRKYKLCTTVSLPWKRENGLWPSPQCLKITTKKSHSEFSFWQK